MDFNPTIPLPSGLLTLDLSYCLITNFNPSIPLPSTIMTLNLSNNKMTLFLPNYYPPLTIISFNISNNLLSDNSINDTLIMLDNNGYSSGNFYLNGVGNGNATYGPPDGINAMLNLISRGCGIYVNT
jgi:hypothetical protein